MTPDQYPKKQDISLLQGTVDVTIDMLSAANKLLCELEQSRNEPESVNQLPILIFDKFIMLLPALNSHCKEWRRDGLTEGQLEQVKGIERRLEEIEKCCLQIRNIMDYLLLEIIPPKKRPIK